MGTERRFLYYLKLVNGTLVHAEGESWEAAAKAAGVNLTAVHRHMPVKLVLTEAEKLAQRERLEKLRKEKQDAD